jgi:hypothetical protein
MWRGAVAGARRAAGAQALRRPAVAQTQRRGMATNGPAYNALMSTTARTASFVVVGAAVTEALYGGITSTMWNVMNRGKLYKDVDWSKLESIYKDDDEEEAEEEDDE